MRCNHEIPSITIIGCAAEHREQSNNMVLVRTGNIAEFNVTVPTLFFFHIHCTGLHHNKGGNVHDRTVPTQMSLQVGYKDLPCKTVHCTRRVSLSRARVSAGQSSLKILTPASPLRSPYSS